MKYNRWSVACESVRVALFGRAWIEMTSNNRRYLCKQVALFGRAWIEIIAVLQGTPEEFKSLSSGERGLKYRVLHLFFCKTFVALFGRAWIEITRSPNTTYSCRVALFGRAWIEMILMGIMALNVWVALFGRAWIEISPFLNTRAVRVVALFGRAWIEIFSP